MKKEFRDMSIFELALARGTLQGYLDIAVKRARQNGTTWAEIGRQLGVSTTEAHRRYHWVEKVTAPGDGA